MAAGLVFPYADNRCLRQSGDS